MTNYLNHIVANPDKYDVTQNTDGTWTIRPSYLARPNEIIQQGTPIDAALMNGITSQLAEKAIELKEVKAPDRYTGPIFTFIDDDATSAFLTVFKPIIDELNVKFTLAAIADAADGASSYYMRKSSLWQLQDEGHEIVAHTKSHQARIYRDDLATEAEIDEEFRYSQQWLKDHGFKGYDTLVFPWGEYPNRLKFKRLARKYYKNALNSRGNHITKFPFDNMFITRVPLTLANDITYYQGLIDDCIAKNGWMIFCTHAGFPDEINATLLRQTIEYIQSKSQPIMTFGDAEKLKGNAISSGEFTDDNAGFFVSKLGNTKVPLTATAFNVIKGLISANGSGLNMNSPITAYERYKTTTTYLNAASDTVANTGGTLITTRGDNDFFAHQEFHLSLKSNFYRRHWNVAGSAWGAWQEFVPKSSYPVVIIEPLVTATGSRTMNDPITAYDAFKETVLHIQGAADTYLGTGGIMKVYRGPAYFRYAEYRPVGTNQIHIRQWQEGSQTWGAWSRANSV